MIEKPTSKEERRSLNKNGRPEYSSFFVGKKGCKNVFNKYLMGWPDLNFEVARFKH